MSWAFLEMSPDSRDYHIPSLKLEASVGIVQPRLIVGSPSRKLSLLADYQSLSS